jgi:hypothetical protein
MKPNILRQTIAALLLALPIAHAEDQKAEEKQEGARRGKTSSSSTVITAADGTATVTIDINGKKETRTFKLGGGNNQFSSGKDGDGAAARGVVDFFGKGAAPHGDAKREKGPWIGIAMEPVQEVVRAQLSLAPGEGIVVSHVAPESPAAKAGLEPNDILLRFEDQILLEPGQLRKLIAMKKPGETVKLGYLRKGERKEAGVTLVEHEIESGENNPPQWFKGMPGFPSMPGAGGEDRLERLQDQLRQLKEKHPGVIVDRRSWLSAPGAGSHERLEALERERDLLDLLLGEGERENSSKGIPNDRTEKMRELRKQSEEALKERRKQIGEEIESARKPFEKEKTDKQP